MRNILFRVARGCLSTVLPTGFGKSQTGAVGRSNSQTFDGKIQDVVEIQVKKTNHTSIPVYVLNLKVCNLAVTAITASTVHYLKSFILIIRVIYSEIGVHELLETLLSNFQVLASSRVLLIILITSFLGSTAPEYLYYVLCTFIWCWTREHVPCGLV
jgi:E3 ubiquitin-protein ligase DOA10